MIFKYDLLKKDENFQIVKFGNKELYNTDSSIAASSWVREKIKNKKTIDMPQIASYLKVKQKGYGKNTEDSLGYLYNDSNNIYKNSQGVCLVSSVFSHGHGVPICDENFLDVVSLFTARKIIKMNWYNEYDEYLKPNDCDLLEQFMYDSIVYSLFSSHSQQSSLRGVTYKLNNWDINNNFFWMSKNRMIEIADNFGYDNLYNDCRLSSDRYVYNILFGEKQIYNRLSQDAKDILDMATNLVEESIEIRQILSNDENHLDSWDAGYAQLKDIWKEHYGELFNQFREAFKEFENRLIPIVYEVGFLKS